ERRRPDPVAHARVAGLGPELLVALRRRRVKPDMRKAGDARLSRRLVAAAAVPGARDEVDVGSGGLLERHERAHAALLALRRIARAHSVAGVIELARRRIESLLARHLEADGVLVRISRRVDQRVV